MREPQLGSRQVGAAGAIVASSVSTESSTASVNTSGVNFCISRKVIDLAIAMRGSAATSGKWRSITARVSGLASSGIEAARTHARIDRFCEQLAIVVGHTEQIGDDIDDVGRRHLAHHVAMALADHK